jgi:hypothetical protein
VRLLRYLALEVVVGVSLIGGGSAACWYGVHTLLETGTAQAAVTQLRDIADPRVPEPRLPTEAALDPLAPPPKPPRIASKTAIFFGYSDQVLTDPLRGTKLTRVKFNRGGSSVSLRVDFATGGRASFKPDQTNLQSVPRKEVAAYRIDRMLGLSHVQPVIAGALPRQEVVAAMDPGARALLPRFNAEVLVTEDGMVKGSLAWWIPEIVDCKIQGFRVDSTDGIVLWKRYLTIGEPIPPAAAQIVPQISSMVVFDFLINNFDRWSGANVKCSPDMADVYYMDNALSFGLDGRGQLKARIYLERSQKFSRSLYEALRRLDPVEVTDAMNTDTGPWESLLTEEEISAMMKRRDYLVSYIDGLITMYGEDAVLVFP